MLSRGRMTPETNNRRLPSEMDPRTAVSSELKIYPIAIPRNVNTEAAIKRIKAISGKEFTVPTTVLQMVGFTG